MGKKRKKIGFIGFGRVVQWQIKQLNNLNLDVVLICDNSEEKLNQAREILPFTKLFNSIHKLLHEPDIPDIDYIIIATPSGSHFEIADLITKYKSWTIIIEKPTFLKPIDFINAKKWNNKIIPIFQNRYNQSVIKAKEIVDSNSLGDISHASLFLDWSRPQRYYDQASWRGTWAEDGGVSTNQGIHYFDILRHILGGFISVSANMKRISVDIECEDYLTAFFEMYSGIPVDLRMTTALRHNREEASLTINGSKGSLKLHGICCNKLSVLIGDEIKNYDQEVEIAYGYGHREFFRLISAEEVNLPIKLPTLHESFLTMQFIYSCYSSAISGNKSSPQERYEDVPLGSDPEEEIFFAK